LVCFLSSDAYLIFSLVVVGFFLAKCLLLLFALETGNKLLVPQQQQQQEKQL
jgi:hypothetical protein